jgi:hypothetical protein
MANEILSSEKLQSGMQWGIEQLIKPNTSVGMISLASTGAGEGAANTDMPWATWSSES